MKTLALSLLAGLIAFGASQEPLPTTPNCEEILAATDTVQNIESFNYPGNYANNLACTWTILASTPGTQVEIEFVGQVVTEACCDFVVVRDGDSSASAVVANFRGNHTGRSYVSTFGAFYITFVSDEGVTEQGFVFRYKEVSFDVADSQAVTASVLSKILSSPGFPNDYPNNTFLIWVISTSEDYRIILRIENFLTEYRSDNLLIRDGDNETSPVIAELRGLVIGLPFFLSSGSVIHLRFRSDSIISAPGFRIGYRRVSKDNIKVAPQRPPIRECGGELEAPAEGHGALKSPGFPGAHAGDLMCFWVITAPEGSRVRVWFNYVHTEECCDWLKIRDGGEPNSPKLGVISGYPRTFQSFISSSNIIRVEFDTDSTQNARGFTGFYEIYRPGGDDIESRCGGDYFADETLQYISTPNWPNAYNANSNCTWVIQTLGLETQVRLHVLGIISEMDFDRMQIFDGNSVLSSHIITLHGKRYNQYIITSTSSFLTIRFISDGNVSHGGFRASYTEFQPSFTGLGIPNEDGKGPR